MASNSAAEADGAIIGLREQIICKYRPESRTLRPLHTDQHRAANATHAFPDLVARYRSTYIKPKDLFDIVTVIEPEQRNAHGLTSYRAFLVYSVRNQPWIGDCGDGSVEHQPLCVAARSAGGVGSAARAAGGIRC